MASPLEALGAQEKRQGPVIPVSWRGLGTGGWGKGELRTAATLCLWRTADRLFHSGNEPVLFPAPQVHVLTHPMQNPQLFLSLMFCFLGSLCPMVLCRSLYLPPPEYLSDPQSKPEIDSWVRADAYPGLRATQLASSLWTEPSKP